MTDPGGQPVLQLPRLSETPECRYSIGTHEHLSEADLRARREQFGFFATEMMAAVGANLADSVEATDVLLDLLREGKSPYYRAPRFSDLRLASIHQLDKLIASASGSGNKEQMQRLQELQERWADKLPKNLYANGPMTLVDTWPKPTKEERDRVNAALHDEEQRARKAQAPPKPAYPMDMYHATKDPVTVYNEQQEAELGPEWSRSYIHREYPKSKYHWDKGNELVIVHDGDEEAALGRGWADSTAAFDAYKGPSQLRRDQINPVKWVDEWSVPGLSADHRKKIRGVVWTAHAKFLRSPAANNACADSMSCAFSGITELLSEGGLLTEQLLKKDIPALVWDSAIAGGWYRFASDVDQNIFTEQLGHYWVWRDENLKNMFGAEIAEGLAKLEGSASASCANQGLRYLPPGQVDKATRKRRWEILTRYQKAKKLATRQDLAGHLGMCLTAIGGMVCGDAKRYGPPTLKRFLEKIGVKPEDW